eukprot:s489_g19.t1
MARDTPSAFLAFRKKPGPPPAARFPAAVLTPTDHQQYHERTRFEVKFRVYQDHVGLVNSKISGIYRYSLKHVSVESLGCLSFSIFT